MMSEPISAGTARSAHVAHLIVLLVPAALLGGALVAQHVFGLYPCEMCMWQRWPHVAALVLATLGLFVGGRPKIWFVILAAIALAVSGALGVLHAGVEYGLWTGPTTCTAPPSISGDFLTDIMSAPIVRCDTAPWSLFGISLAGYNALISLIGAGAALWMILKSR